MACTMKELQDAELGILCQFADFCTQESIPYGLSGGTLLGAIRHKGFIPWDDDIDVHMDVRAFKKIVRRFRKNPIPGLHLSWIDSDAEYPFYHAKLRKNGTFMPEASCKSFDMHNGVWIDLFVYTGLPKNKLFAKVQEKLYFVFATTARMYLYDQIDAKNGGEAQYSAKYRFLKGLSRKRMRRLRKLLFALYTSLGSSRSELVTYNDWSQHPKEPLPRSFEMPQCKHVFCGREFLIPQNYDASLTKQYGDYMTPVEYPLHTELDKIEL